MRRFFFINTGTKRNLGDRAMLINHLDYLKSQDAGQAIVSDDFPIQFQQEFKTETSPLMYHCFFRYKALEKRLPLYLFCISLTFAGCFIVAKLMPIFPRLNRIRLSEIVMTRQLLSADTIIFSGGGYLTDQGKIECWGCLLTGLLGALLGKRIVFSGVGIGPVHSKVTTLLLKRVARYAHYIMLRDETGSRQLLESLKVATEKMISLGDDAFSLPISAPNNPIKKHTRQTLAVHFRLSPFTDDIKNKTDRFFKIIEHINKQGWDINFYIFAAQTSWEMDYITAAITTYHLERVQIISSDDPRVLKDSIGKCHLSIGIAYHFLVFSLDCAVPAIGIYSGDYYKQKITGLFKWFAMENYTMDIQQLDDTHALDKIEQAIEHAHPLEKQLTERKTILKQHLLEHFRTVYLP